MKTKATRILMLALALLFCVSGSVMAFTDVQEGPDRDKLNELREAKIMNGIGGDKFDPKGKLTYAQGITILVNGFDLNIDHIRFIKEPLAQDYYEKVPNDAWYATSFIIAHHNGIELPKDVDPKAAMTREAFTHAMIQAMQHKADFAVPEIFLLLADEQDVEPTFMSSLQTALILEFAKLDKDNKFYPKREITRLEAALMLHAGIKFLEKHTDPVIEPMPVDPDEPVTTDNKVTMEIEKVTDEVSKVILKWGVKPSSGYTISVQGIEFEGEKATVLYDLHYPKEDMSYLTVITEPTAVTYVSTAYMPIISEVNPEPQLEPKK